MALRSALGTCIYRWCSNAINSVQTIVHWSDQKLQQNGEQPHWDTWSVKSMCLAASWWSTGNTQGVTSYSTYPQLRELTVIFPFGPPLHGSHKQDLIDSAPGEAFLGTFCQSSVCRLDDQWAWQADPASCQPVSWVTKIQARGSKLYCRFSSSIGSKEDVALTCTNESLL